MRTPSLLQTLVTFCVLQTQLSGYTFQWRFGRAFGELQGVGGWLRSRSARHGEGTSTDPGNPRRTSVQIRNQTRNDAAHSRHPVRQGNSRIITNPTTIPGVKNTRENSAKSSWNNFLLRRGSDFMSILPIKQSEVDQRLCRTVPFPQSVHQEDCETVVLENNVCFGKCSARTDEQEDHGRASCAHCSPVKFTRRTVQLKCKDNTQISKVVTVVEDCHCELKNGKRSYNRCTPSLFDPVTGT